MLKPVPIPTSADPAAWERLRAFFVSSEMEGDGKTKLTPAQAAQQSNARTENVFRGALPGQALPLALSAPSRESGLPGGMRTADGRTWVIVSRPEDDRSAFPKSERITPEVLRKMAESYDPEGIHRAPVVLPEGGPAHWTGEFSREMAGDVDGLEFDGYFLWALVKERDGRVTEAVNDGLGNRSIRWFPSLPAAGGAPYLRHLAIMAEPAGTENLGLLDHFFSHEQKGKGRSGDEIDALLQLAVCDRNLQDIPTLDAESVGAAKETVMSKEPENTDIAKLVEAEVTRVLAASKPAAEPAKVNDEIRVLIDKLTAGTASLDAKVKAVDEVLAKLDAGAKETRKAEISRGLDILVRERRLAPTVRETLERTMPLLSDEEVKAEFDKLAKAPVVGPSTRDLAIVNDPDTGANMTVPAHLTAPPETGLAVADPIALRLEAEARQEAEKESDPEKARAVYTREILKRFGGGEQNAASFLN